MSESVVGEWAKDKLDRLGKYLQAYTVILSRQQWCKGFHYVDAFAGPGIHQIRKQPGMPTEDFEMLFGEAAQFQRNESENSQLISGSPLIALNVDPPFTTYTFVEMDRQRIAALTKLAPKDGSTVSCIPSDCSVFLRETFIPAHDWKHERAVVFLDPFGMQVNWETISALAATKAIEIFLNFPVGMAIQRLLLRNPDEYTTSSRKKLDDYFGTDEWFNVLYKKKKTLFGDEEDKIAYSGEALLRWYKSRLAAAFGYVSSAYLIRNSKRGHLYYLMLASPNKTGAKIASHVLGAGEKVSD
jgi:three-Cys-motif partner protein